MAEAEEEEDDEKKIVTTRCYHPCGHRDRSSVAKVEIMLKLILYN